MFNASTVLFYVRNTLSAVSIKKIYKLLRRGKRTSQTECGEGQNFLGSYSLIKIRMGRVEGEEGVSF